MFNLSHLFFTADFQSEIDPAQLVIVASIGIIAIVVMIKKINDRRKQN